LDNNLCLEEKRKKWKNYFIQNFAHVKNLNSKMWTR